MGTAAEGDRLAVVAGSPARVPTMPRPLLPEALRTLPLTPTDGFILSRVDGVSSERDIAMATGLAESDVHDSVTKLAKLGVVTVPPEAEEKAEAAPPVPPRTSFPPPSSERSRKVLDDPAKDEVVDLEPETRQRVIELYAKLDSSNHYEVLGIPLESDKKAVKRAYFELATHVHPDRFFRKNLGSYKPKMEAIFVRLTLAHDVLTSKEKRPEYDTYLNARASARRIESLSDLKAVKLPSNSLPIAGPSASDPVPAPAPLLIDERGRRELLARRLGRSSKRPSGPMPIGSGIPSPPVSESRIVIPPERSSDPDALKRLFEERLGQARALQSKKHVEAGDEALARGDVVTAATSFRTALSFLPEDPEISQKLADVTDRATAALAEAYRKQAVYEEKNGQWVEASRSWSRLAKLLPTDEDVQDSAAKAIVQGGGDLHEAATFAQRAVNDNPESARFRKTLGSVYLAAGLKKNARRELEAAARISPDDDTIQDLLKRAI